MPNEATTVGRFAPSPTGPLHMGSLVMATASFLDAKHRAGEWFIRIDDIDPPRAQFGAAERILASLKAHGLNSDRTIQYQSNHSDRYQTAYETLQADLFYCTCTRAVLKDTPIYPGTCRAQRTPINGAATRIDVSNWQPIEIEDGYLPTRIFQANIDFGDFIIKRKDGLWSYNFATAIDDSRDVTHVVRGQDLAEMTGPQIGLMRAMARMTPTYSHLPLLKFTEGEKLSKHTHAAAIDDNDALANLRFALETLGVGMSNATSIEQLLQNAASSWRLNRVPQSLEPFPRTETGC